jgi:hypothetical protein
MPCCKCTETTPFAMQHTTAHHSSTEQSRRIHSRKPNAQLCFGQTESPQVHPIAKCAEFMAQRKYALHCIALHRISCLQILFRRLCALGAAHQFVAQALGIRELLRVPKSKCCVEVREQTVELSLAKRPLRCRQSPSNDPIGRSRRCARASCAHVCVCVCARARVCVCASACEAHLRDVSEAFWIAASSA